MMKLYTYNAWVDTFKPIKNKISKYADDTTIQFDTHNAEGEFVKEQDPKHIWTEVDGDEGTYIIAGYHYVNRIQYYVTEKPWDDDFIEVPTWAYRSCDCSDNTEDEEFDPNCPLCEEGMIDVPTDTVEDIKAIYGEGVEIVA